MLPTEVKTTSLQRVTGVGGGQAPRTPGRLSGGRTQITPLGAVLPRHARPRLSVQIGGYMRTGSVTPDRAATAIYEQLSAACEGPAPDLRDFHPVHDGSGRVERRSVAGYRGDRCTAPRSSLRT